MRVAAPRLGVGMPVMMMMVMVVIVVVIVVRRVETRRRQVTWVGCERRELFEGN